MANWEVFKSLKDLREFLNSDNTEILYQGINRFKQHLGYSKDKSTKEIDLSNDEKFSIVYEYLQTSTDCKELFRIWDMQLRNNLTRLELSMPDLFSKIIKFTTTVPSLKPTGTIIIRNIIRNYMKIIRNSLSPEKLPLCQNTLKLLIVMNSHDLVTTKELLESFTYNLNLKELERLLNIRRNTPKDKLKSFHAQNDIRTLYVRFILSFFVHGDAKVKSNVLEIKDFVSSIFKGLSNDSYEFVDEVLRKVYNYIILDNDMNRKIKLSFFNNTWLFNKLLLLYNRREPEQPESNNIVANIIHQFLLSICCTPGVGICFRDAGLYPFNFMKASFNASIDETNERQMKVHNIILFQFIKLLKPTQDLRQQELLLKILEACPELVKPYWDASKLSFKPNLSYKWLTNMTLLQKIIMLSFPSLYIPNTQTYPENPPELNTILENILPRIFDQVTLVECLNHSSSLIKYKTMIVLYLAVQKLDTVVHSINKAGSLKWNQMTDSLYEEMMHRIPDIQILLSLYKDLLLNMKRNEDSDEQIRNNMMHECILKLIKFYHLNFPKMVTEVKLNVDNLIPMDFQEYQLGLQLNILELLFLIAKSNWTINPEFNHLQTLLKIYLTTSYTQIRSITQHILEQLLSNSIIFQHDPDEVSIWLDSLPRIFPENTDVEKFNGQAAVLQFLDSCFTSFLKDPNPYIDNLNHVINNVNEKRKQDTVGDGETKKDVELYLKFQDISKNSNPSYPFSPLIVTLVRNYKNITNNKIEIMSFLHMLFKKLFSKQILVDYLDEYIKQLENNVGLKSIGFLECRGKWNIDEYFSSLKHISSLYKYPNEESFSVNRIVDIPVIISEIPQEELNILNQNLMKAEKLCLEILRDKSPVDITKARSKFLDMLYILPTSIFERNLVEIINYVKNILVWMKFEPILEYICERYPGSSSLFNIQTIKEVIDYYIFSFNKENNNVLPNNIVETRINSLNSFIELLNLIPFSILFDNSFPSYLADKNISLFLIKSLQSTSLQHIFRITKQILVTTKVLLSDNSSIQKLQTCFNLLKIIIEKVTEEVEDDDVSKIFNDIVILIFEQDLLTFFLASMSENQQSTLNFKKNYSILDEFIAELVVYFTNREIKNIVWKTRSAKALNSFQPFKNKLFNQLLYIINSVDLYKDKNTSIYEKTFALCYKFNNFWNEEEIFQLFLSTLESRFYNNKYINNNKYYKKFLSFLLNKLSNTLLIIQINEEILLEFFSCRIVEMDSIILQIIENYLPSGLIEKKNNYILYNSEQQLFHPIISKCVKITQYFLDNLNSNRAKIIGHLMLCTSEIRELFVNWILNNQNLSEQIAISDIVILVNSLLETISTIYTNSLDFKYFQVTWTKLAKEDEKKSIHKISELYALKFLQNISKSIIMQEKPSIYALITCALLNLSPSKQVLDNLENNIKNKLSSDSFNLDFLCIVECYFINNINYYKENELKKFISNYLHYATLFIEKDEYKKYNIKYIQTIFRKIDILIKLCVPKSSNLDANIIGEFIFVLLEKKFEDPIILNCIISLIKFTYNKKKVLGPSLDKVIEAIINNSQFNILIKSSESSDELTESSIYTIRSKICYLLNLIYHINSKECCKLSYLVSLLSIYNATTSVSDQLLLDIFILYEKTTKVSIISSAIKWKTNLSNLSTLNNKYQLDKKNLIIGQRILVETLELIDPMLMMRSFTHFPIDKELEIDYNYIEKLLFDNNFSMIIMEKKISVYDSSYFLPLFASLLSYGNLLDCRKFIEINALGFVVVATSSLVINVRRIAYYLLDEFYVLLEHTNFREKNQILLLLNLLKNSITNRDNDDIQRIPTIITIFIAHSLNIFMNPGHFMYPLINKFLLQRPFLDLKDIPMFYSLFHSSTNNYQREKVWILRLLSAGLKTYDDYKIFNRRHIWNIISCYYTSPLADNITRKLIIEILFQAASIPKVITNMIKNQGLLTWLYHICISSLPEQSLFGLRILLRVLLGCKNSALQWSNCTLVKQSICILTGLLRSFEEIRNVEEKTLLWRLNYLNSVLRIFHYLTLISPMPGNILSQHNASILISLLEKCEIHLSSVDIMNSASLSDPTEIQHNFNPSLTDKLDELYTMDHDIAKVYKEIIRMMFEMIVISCNTFEDDLVKKIIGRSLRCSVSIEARKWIIECLADKRNYGTEVKEMDIEV